MIKVLCAFLLFISGSSTTWAQRLEFPAGEIDDAGLARALPILARQVIAIYADENRGAYLSNRFRLQMVAGDYAAANSTVQNLRELNATQGAGGSSAALAPDEIMAAAMARTATGMTLEDATKAAFRDLFGRLDDKAAIDAIYWLWGPVGRFHDNVAAIATRSAGSGAIELGEALELIRNYQLFLEYRTLIPLTEALIREDDARRYVVLNDVPIRAKDGTTLCASIVRPKNGPERRPTALNFTIYAVPNRIDNARQAAAHGYAGMIANARGKACSPDRIVPWEVEAQDTHAVIDWISKQPWSDGQVGMYGGSYEGFAQWAAVKRMHPALKTIVPWAAVHPGLILPMSNNVFQNANYQWAFYVTNNKYLDEAASNDQERWNSLNSRWYASGRPYRDVDKVDGAPNNVLKRQLLHPAFDQYWQGMAPYGAEFAKIRIPVLQIAGYFDPAQIAALYYLSQHSRYHAKAEHYLVIGPYGHHGAVAAWKPPHFNGYAIDAVAQFDTVEMTYQWFDYVMKGGRKPELLKDKVNFEVMGANTWRHAPSVAAMSNGTLTFYLSDARTGDRYRLDAKKPAARGFLEQTVDFANRDVTSTNNLYPDGVVVKNLELKNGFTFISDAFPAPMSIDGVIGGVIKASINKKDMDITLAFYEVMPDGEYFNLGYYLGRASFSHDRRVRRLLEPGKIESVPIAGVPLVSRRLQKGSRLLVQLTVNKNQYAQLNYGTGRDVSDESIADAGVPLQVRWQNDSYITVPITRSSLDDLPPQGSNRADSASRNPLRHRSRARERGPQRRNIERRKVG